MSLSMNGNSTWLFRSAGGEVLVFLVSNTAGVNSSLVCASHPGSAEQLVSWKVEVVGMQVLPLCCCQHL